MLTRRLAFTLIELLIVVMIIATLAAIAVPNFLEAQTRAKVSRTKSDLRALCVALEAYRTDNNSYPVHINAAGRQGAVLSTPICYITNEFLTDPFTSPLPASPFTSKGQTFYTYHAIQGRVAAMEFLGTPGLLTFPGAASDEAARQYLITMQYMLEGRGPDRALWVELLAGPPTYQVTTANLGTVYGLFMRQLAAGRGAYDPTNGTYSIGSVMRSRYGEYPERKGY